MEVSVVEVAVLQDVDDETLASRAASDFEAFSELYRRYLFSICAFVRSRMPSDEVAEDLTAQIFFKAYTAAGSWRGEGSYRSWLFRIAQNSIATWHTTNKRTAIAVEQVPERIDPTPSPASQVLVGEARDMVWRKVAELPPAQREAVTLRYLKDLSIEEISKLTERTSGAVRILLHRARARLRRMMEES